MTTILPILALGFAALSYLLGLNAEQPKSPAIARSLAVLGIAALGVWAENRYGDEKFKLGIEAGFVLGAALSMVAAAVPSRRDVQASCMALGVFGVAALLVAWPDQIRWSALALTAGLGLGALALADDHATLTAIGGSLIAAATVLGSYGEHSYLYSAVAIGLGVCILGIFRQVALRFKPGSELPVAIVVRVLALALAYGVGSRYLGLKDAWIAMALGLAAGVAVWAATPNDDDMEPGRAVISVVIWIGLGTLAFGLARGYGMAMALALAAGVHLVLAEKRALATCGPLLGLVMYRVFREAHLDASRALDLGQHYALIGLSIGAALPILPDRWWSRKPDNHWLQAVGGLLWAIVWASAPALAALLLGPKGSIGFVVGVGLSSLFLAVGRSSSLLPLAIAAAAGALSSLCYGLLADLSDLTREEKQHWMLMALVPLTIIGLILAVIGFRKPSPSGSLEVAR